MAQAHHCRAVQPQEAAKSSEKGVSPGLEAKGGVRSGFSQNELFKRAVGWEAKQREAHSNPPKPFSILVIKLQLSVADLG